MANIQPVIHRGVVERVTPETIEVRMQVASSCGACRARDFCGTASEKRFAIPNGGQPVQAGDEVRLVLASGNGLTAVWWGYGCPLALLLLILVFLQAYGVSDAWSGIAGASGVAAYYGILYGCKNKLKRTFRFEIKEIDRRT
ncbi:MAG: SoxR reducing system RseC family protein [Prevotellaceae bacterium]|jgi:sigma-E factor negative regulatory protein RseC|nr:SoxR reducing system RseC family protein [Prevotellaceae bacterium]